MGVKRYWVQDGIFLRECICVPMSIRTSEIRAGLTEIFERYNPKKVIDKIVKQAVTALMEFGYPTDWRLFDDDQLNTYQPRIRDLRNVLFRSDCLKKAMTKQDINSAVLNMFWLTQSAMKAEIRLIEEMVFVGAHRKKQLVDFGKRRGSDLHEESLKKWVTWKRLAQEIKKTHPHLSKIRIAEIVQKRLRCGDSVNTIRRRI